MTMRALPSFFVHAALGAASLLAPLGIAQEKDITNAAPAPGERPASQAWEAGVTSGIPHPIEAGVGRRFHKSGLLGIYGGRYQQDFKPGKGFDTLKGSVAHLEARYREETLAPGRSFWALALGYQELEVEGSKNIVLSNSGYTVPIATKVRLQLETVYWAPQFGWTLARQNNLRCNMSFGLQIPLHSSADVSSRFTDDDFIDESIKSTKSYRDTEKDAESIAARLGKLALPIIKIIDLATSF